LLNKQKAELSFDRFSFKIREKSRQRERERERERGKWVSENNEST